MTGQEMPDQNAQDTQRQEQETPGIPSAQGFLLRSQPDLEAVCETRGGYGHPDRFQRQVHFGQRGAGGACP